jgi:hypothetical protein
VHPERLCNDARDLDIWMRLDLSWHEREIVPDQDHRLARQDTRFRRARTAGRSSTVRSPPQTKAHGKLA